MAEIDKETTEFIMASLQEGRSIEQVRWDLLSSGWRSTDADAAIAAATGKIPPSRPKNAPAPEIVPAKGRLAGIFYLAAAIILGAAFFMSEPFSLRNWIVQYLIVLLLWVWIGRGDYYFGLGKGLFVAIMTGSSIFLIGIKMMTVNFGCALLLALFGGRWQSEGKRWVAVVIGLAMSVWFVVGIVEPEARFSVI